MHFYIARQIWIAVAINLGQMLVGYSMGWTAPVVPKLQDPEQSPLPNEVTETESSFIGSIFILGTIVGPYATGYLSNSYGRKVCFYLAGSVKFGSFLLLANAYNIAMILAGRIFLGVGTGIIFVLNLVYIGEIASTNIRGILLTCTAISSTFGTVVVYSIGPFVSYPAVSYIAMGIVASYLVGIYFTPESPVYHALKDRKEAVKETLQYLGRMDDFDVVMASKVNIEKQQSALEEWKQIITVKSNRKALFITLTLGILQQGSGIMAVIFFATTIFGLAASSVQPHIATIIVGISQFSATIVTPFFVERYGRKILLLISTILCSFSLVALGVYFYLDDIEHSSIDKIQWLPLVSLVIYFITYNIGFGIIPPTLVGEMFQANVRSTGSTVTLTGGWVFGFTLTSVFGSMIAGLGSYGTFWIFSGICVVAFIFTFLFVPETKGKTLAEVQEMLSK